MPIGTLQSCLQSDNYKLTNTSVKCHLEEVRGFIKWVCSTANQTRNRLYKCHNSEEHYREGNGSYLDSNLRGKTCSNDPYFYQACGTAALIGTEKRQIGACGDYLCLHKQGTWFIVSGRSIEAGTGYALRCDGEFDCKNTQLDEANCENYKIKCDGICHEFNCKDEDNCPNTTPYKLKCEKRRYFLNKKKGIVPSQICDGVDDCRNSEDERECNASKVETYMTCKGFHSDRVVPILSFLRCIPFKTIDREKEENRYCRNYKEQTNCSDYSRVGLTCKIEGALSTVSQFMICYNKQLCDDNIENECLSVSGNLHDCRVHKHALCDGQDDCLDQSDERHVHCTPMMPGRGCIRRVSKKSFLPIPLKWIMDGVEDCVGGVDELRGTWPTCQSGKSVRQVVRDENCEIVFICPLDEPGFVELGELCDGINTCGNENGVCSADQGALQLYTQAVSSHQSMKKFLSYCLEGIKNSANFRGKCLEIPFFIFPDYYYFGVTDRTTVFLPKYALNCDHAFGELYVYTSCNNKCVNSLCPLRNAPKTQVCPGQFPDRIGTIANNRHATFFTKIKGNLYDNRYFVCDNLLLCIDYSNVCDLVDNCGDGSDEKFCTNHFQCTGTKKYISRVKKCDGSFDCPDLSDECNDECTAYILDNTVLKISSWLIAVSAVLLNLATLIQSHRTLKDCQNITTLANRMLILTVFLGDFLVGLYLLVISIYDFMLSQGETYCSEQITWKGSPKCSYLGVLSTVGSQTSLFAMCALSIIRLYGVHNGLATTEVTSKRVIQLLSFVLSLFACSVIIAVAPLLNKFEDYFVNGVHFSKDLQIFAGVISKKEMIAILEAYYGRIRKGTLSWKISLEMAREMFNFEQVTKSMDHTAHISKNSFYGSDGVCLFKYFVTPDDPQRIYVWIVLIVNVLCFIIIMISYVFIGFYSTRSSQELDQSGNNQPFVERNRQLNRKIAIVIVTDFVCWIPFVFVCIIHSMKIVDATPWYSFFSMIVLPINSVINPIIYDPTFLTVLNRATNIVKQNIDRIHKKISMRREAPAVNMEMQEIGAQTTPP